MIKCENVSFAYPANQATGKAGQAGGSLKNITCTIHEGEFVLLCGASGCGKTTLTRLFNGLIPHYYEGTLTGSVTLDGKEYRDLSLFDISERVGSVFQNPRSQFFNVDTTSEIAFGCENHGMPESEILEQIQGVSAQLNLKALLDRSIFSLSGGEKQKIACGSAAAVGPDIYILDEPSSNLDVYAISDFRKLLQILKSRKKTVVIAEHRLYYLRDFADRVIYLKNGEILGDYTAAEFRSLPKEERTQMGLRPLDLSELSDISREKARNANGLWTLSNFYFSYRNDADALSINYAEFPAAGVTAVIGHNGAGKTTFSRCLCGLEKRCRGVLGKSGTAYSARQRLKMCYMVMQDVNHQLFTESVLDEVLLSMHREDRDLANRILDEMDLLPYADCHPMGLSGGQKQRVAVASAIASERPIILFDEPTSGLDLFHMRQVADSVKRLSDNGKTVLIVTHDPEFILRCCNYVIHLEAGEIEEQYFLDEDSNKKRLLDFFRPESGGDSDSFF